MKPRVYQKKRSFAQVLDGILRVVVVLLLLGLVVFFLFRSWTVYDDTGAHIVFPWSETGETMEIN